jgi:hypothetical protein
MLWFVNCTLAENSATGGKGEYATSGSGSAYGGAIYSSTNALSLLNTTLALNSVIAEPGAGIWEPLPVALGSSLYVSSNTNTFLTNTILSCAPAETNVYGGVVDGGHNICSDASAKFSTASSHNSLDPLLGPVGSYGSSTLLCGLLPNSPAIDAGDDSVCPPTDQRGVSRPKGLACDIGAFELTPTLTLTASSTNTALVNYAFRANQTNLVSASPDLASWVTLGTRVTDTNGVFQIEEVNLSTSPIRFYRVDIQGGR